MWVPENKVGTIHTSQHKEQRPPLTSSLDERGWWTSLEELPEEVGRVVRRKK